MANLSLADIAKHPITAISTGFAATAHLLSVAPIDALAGVIWANLANLFTFSSLFAFTIAPNIPEVPQRPFLVLAVVLAVGWALKIGIDVIRDYRSETS